MSSLEQLWDELFSTQYRDQVIDLAFLFPDKRSIEISRVAIDRFSSELGDAIFETPDIALAEGNKALMDKVKEDPAFDYERELTVHDLFIHIVDLGKITKIRDVRSEHLDKLVQVNGLVRSVTQIEPKVAVVAIQCKRCGYTFKKTVEGTKTLKNLKCPNQACDRGGPFDLIKKDFIYIDSQRLTLQEFPESMRPGEQPHTIKLELTGDLPGKVTPGERVTASAIFRSIVDLDKGPSCKTYMDCLAITAEESNYDQVVISEEEKEAIIKLSRDPAVHQKIASSIAPAIFGSEDIKEALSLQLVSTPARILPGGTRRRGDIHILLVGDPGLAKSQLLRHIAAISPRGVFASGKSATTAGLTCAVVKDPDSDQWMLEAGALPMADGGIASIDELDKMRDEDRSALHEAMEAQTISIAKAGILATLKCGCSVLAAANPKHGRFDKYEAITPQINLQPALLTRFDLIFAIADEVDAERDRAVAEKILRGNKDASPFLDPTFLRKYVAYCRKLPAPEMSEEAFEIIMNAYLGTRLSASKNTAIKPIPITPRYLEGMIRLAEASARIRLAREVSSEDATRATRIMQNCLHKVGIDPESGDLDVDTLEIGVSKTTQDRSKLLKSLIRGMTRHFPMGIPLEDILSEAENNGINNKKALEIIQRLRRDGDLYERGKDRYLLGD